MFHVPDQPGVYGPRLEWMNELGVSWDRIDLWWHVVEPEPGNFDFSRPDKVFDTFEAHGVRWYPILCYGAARWEGHNAPQTDEEIQRFADYAFRVVNRYRDRARYWSVWNEPNIPNFWSPEPNPERYAQLLKATRESVRRADPEAKLCAPAIAPLGSWDRKFVERLYQLGCKDDFDVFDYHYYRNYPPEREVPREIAEICAVMHRYGDDKPIWVSESGVNSPIRDKPESYDRQAALVVRNQLLCLALGVERFFYFDLQNWHDDPEGEWDASLGLVEAGSSKKPSFTAYRTLVRETDHKDFIGRCEGWEEDVEGVLIHDPNTGELILAAWYTGREKTHEVSVICEKRDVTIVGPDGNTSVLPLAADEAVSIDPTRTIRIGLDARPRYIHGVDPEAWLPLAGLRLDPALTILTPGEKARLRLRVHPLLYKAKARVNLTRTPAWFSWDPSSGELKCDPNHPPGRFTVTALIEFESGYGDARRPMRVSRSAEVEVVPVLALALRPYVEGGQLHLEASMTNQSGRAMREPLRVMEYGPDGERVVGERKQEPLQPNEARKVYFPGETIGAESYESPALWVLHYGSTPSEPFRVGIARFSNKEPTIDGDLSEWGEIPPMTVADDRQINRNSGSWTPEDASAEIRAWFTGDTLFLAADVTDDAPIHNPSPPLKMYRGDAVEVFIGFRGPSRRTVIDKAFEYQIGLSPTSNAGKPSVFWFHKDVPIDNAHIEVRKTEKGYAMEASIPLAELGVPDLPLAAGRLLAFDVTLNDLDPDDWAPAGNDPGRSLSWNGGSMNWIDPSGWGMVILRDEGPQTTMRGRKKAQ